MPRIDGKTSPHGTPQRARWCHEVDGWRCAPCKAALAAVQQECRRRRREGISVWHDTADVLAHIRYLVKEGMTVKLLCQRSGMSSSTMSLLQRGIKTRIGIEAERRVLAVQPDPRARYRLPPRASVLRYRSLIAEGYRRSDIIAVGRALGHNSFDFRPERQQWINRPTVELLIEICLAVEGKPGPSELTRSRAVRFGYKKASNFDWWEWRDPDWNGVPDRSGHVERAAALLEDAAYIERFQREASNDLEKQANRHEVEQRLGVSYSYIRKLRANVRQQRQGAACLGDNEAVA